MTDDSNTKPTNPKDAVGIKKAPISTVSMAVVAEVGVAMLEGARKYGRHNYRHAGVRASVYFDAAVLRHMGAWWEGEDLDPDSGLSHVTKAIASLFVLRDAMINDMLIDDRPRKIPSKFFKELNNKAAEVIEKYPDAKEAYINGDPLEEKKNKPTEKLVELQQKGRAEQLHTLLKQDDEDEHKPAMD